MCLSVILTKLIGYRTVMRGSRNFRQGGGGGGGPGQKSSDNLFFSPQLILQKVNG